MSLENDYLVKLNKLYINFFTKLNLYFSTITNTILIISFIYKTLRYKYLLKILIVIILMYKQDKLYLKIYNYFKLAKSIIIFIIYSYDR